MKISLISACYNEEENIPVLYDRILDALKGAGHELEIIFVDNGSIDGSEAVLRALAEKDNRVKAIIMSRNFGTPQSSYLAGIQHCSGDAAVLIDSDLQDPPEVIPEMIKKWKDGYDVVYGVRKNRKAGFLRKLAYKAFYRIFKKMSYIEMPLDAGEFGLIDRKVINILKEFPENQVYIRGLRAYAGFKQAGVEYVRDSRKFGFSNTNIFNDALWAKRLITNFSYKPLEWISYIAFFAFVISLIGILVNLTLYIMNPASPPGMPTLIFGLLFFGAVQLLALSIIGEYVAHIMREVKNRPRYIIKEIIKKP